MITGAGPAEARRLRVSEDIWPPDSAHDSKGQGFFLCVFLFLRGHRGDVLPLLYREATGSASAYLSVLLVPFAHVARFLHAQAASDRFAKCPYLRI